MSRKWEHRRSRIRKRDGDRGQSLTFEVLNAEGGLSAPRLYFSGGNLGEEIHRSLCFHDDQDRALCKYCRENLLWALGT